MGWEFSRRNLLQVGSTAAGTAVIGTLAGCAQFDQHTGGGDDSDGGATATEADEPSRLYRTWLPEPDAFDEDHYYFWEMDYDQFRANESHFDPEVREGDSQAEFLAEQFGISDEAVDDALFIGPVEGSGPAVVSGRFSGGDITEYLTDNGATEHQDIGEYTVYRNPDQGVVGVTDGTLVVSGGDTVDRIRTLVETKNGEVSRYQDTSDDMATLLERFGPETYVGGDTSDPYTEAEADPESFQFAGQVGYSFGETVDGDTTTTEIVVLFETAADVDMDAISEFTGSDWFDSYSDLSSEQADRMALITGDVPTDEFYVD